MNNERNGNEKIEREKNIVEIIKYGFWGAITTIFNLVLFFFLKDLGLYYIAANILSYFAAVVLNYVLNRTMVFKTSKSSYNSKKEFARFFLVRLLSLVVDNGLFYILVSLLNLEVNVTRVILSIAIILATYFINKRFVFNKQSKAEV